MPHLLLVDDDEDILSLLTNFFRKHGHAVSVATDGEGMFAALEKQDEIERSKRKPTNSLSAPRSTSRRWATTTESTGMRLKSCSSIRQCAAA